MYGRQWGKLTMESMTRKEWAGVWKHLKKTQPLLAKNVERRVRRKMKRYSGG